MIAFDTNLLVRIAVNDDLKQAGTGRAITRFKRGICPPNRAFINRVGITLCL